MLIRPSYRQGFARSVGESKYPTLWRGLVGAFIPNLGNTGYDLRNNITKENIAATSGTPLWDNINLKPNDAYYDGFIPDPYQATSDGFTIVFKINNEAASGWPGIFALKSFAEFSTNNGYSISCRNPGTLHFKVGLSDTIPSNNSWIAGTDIFVVCRWKPGVQEVWINDVETGYATHAVAGSAPNASAANLRVATYYDGASTYTMNGQDTLFYILAYNRFLTNAEMSFLFMNQLAPFQLADKPFGIVEAGPPPTFIPAWALRHNTLIGGGLDV